MSRACLDCHGPISRRSKGRCQSCCNRVAYRSPEGRARLSAMMREQRQDDWFNQAMIAANPKYANVGRRP